jgi:hypothetical protein
MAVGILRPSLKSPTQPLALRWNGKSWKAAAARAPAGSNGAYLNGVSCPSAKNCYAVGSYSSGSTLGSTLVEHWNGSAWSIVASPNAAGAATTSLAGVSCSGAGAALACVAVGSYSPSAEGNPYYAVAERMVRGRWYVVSTPKVSNGQSNALTGVSCSSASSCFAVGGRRRGLGATLIEHWDGKKWAVAVSSNPKGYRLSQFGGISCTSAKSCVAVGLSSTDAVTPSTLINRWNGKRWTIDTSSKPKGAAGSSFASVSCVSASKCVAVGTYLTSKFANPPAGFSVRHG